MLGRRGKLKLIVVNLGRLRDGACETQATEKENEGKERKVRV